MSLIIYLIGFAFVIGGIAWALIVAGVTTLYVMIAIVILVGIAILMPPHPMDPCSVKRSLSLAHQSVATL